LWVHGPSGSGRSSAIAQAVRRAAGGFRTVRRVQAFPELLFEEVLDHAAALLAQAGDTSLSRALEQRTSAEARIALLFEAFARTPVLLWLDDLDDLEDAGGSELLGEFLARCRTSAAARGRIILTTERPPAPGGFLVVPVAPLDARRAAQLWREIAPDLGPAAPVLDALPAPERLPFTLALLAGALRRARPGDGPPGRTEVEDVIGGAGAGDAPGAAGDSALGAAGRLIDRLLDRAIGGLAPAARASLEALAVFPPAPSRQALREVAALSGPPPASRRHGAGSVPPIEELASLGLLDAVGQSILETSAAAAPTVHQRVRRFVRERLGGSAPERSRELHAAAAGYHARLAAKSGSPWDLVKAWRGFQRAGLQDEAYEVHKAFLQDVLARGHYGIARSVLETTVERASGSRRAVAMGNLAMVYKGTGEHARAEKIYERVHQDFLRAGDLVNAARTLHQLGNTQYAQGQYDEALATYRHSLELSSQLERSPASAATRIQLGNALCQRGEPEKALEAYVEARAEIESLPSPPDRTLQAVLDLQIAQIHVRANRHLDAETHLKRAEEAARDSGDLRNLLKVLQAQGLAARKRRDHDEASRRYDDALRAALALGDALEAAGTLVLRAELETERVQLADAVACYLRARALLEARAAGGEPALAPLRERVSTGLEGLERRLGAEIYQRVVAARSGPAAEGEPRSG
jgi:tetratricopeptide (TPR) repeat protein